MEHTIQISDTIYQLLCKRSIIEGTVPDEMAERLLANALQAGKEQGGLYQNGVNAEHHVLADTDTALEAVRRLTTLFADVEIEHFNDLADDPTMTLENANLDFDSAFV